MKGTDDSSWWLAYCSQCVIFLETLRWFVKQKNLIYTLMYWAGNSFNWEGSKSSAIIWSSWEIPFWGISQLISGQCCFASWLVFMIDYNYIYRVIDFVSTCQKWTLSRRKPWNLSLLCGKWFGVANFLGYFVQCEEKSFNFSNVSIPKSEPYFLYHVF